jgi:hypothetical protein
MMTGGPPFFVFLFCFIYYLERNPTLVGVFGQAICMFQLRFQQITKIAQSEHK